MSLITDNLNYETLDDFLRNLDSFKGPLPTNKLYFHTETRQTIDLINPPQSYIDSYLIKNNFPPADDIIWDHFYRPIYRYLLDAFGKELKARAFIDFSEWIPESIVPENVNFPDWNDNIIMNYVGIECAYNDDNYLTLVTSEFPLNLVIAYEQLRIAHGDMTSRLADLNHHKKATTKIEKILTHIHQALNSFEEWAMIQTTFDLKKSNWVIRDNLDISSMELPSITKGNTTQNNDANKPKQDQPFKHTEDFSIIEIDGANQLIGSSTIRTIIAFAYKNFSGSPFKGGVLLREYNQEQKANNLPESKIKSITQLSNFGTKNTKRKNDRITNLIFLREETHGWFRLNQAHSVIETPPQ